MAASNKLPMAQCPYEDQQQAVPLKGTCWDQKCSVSLLMTHIVGLSAPPESLWIIPSWVVQSTHWWEGTQPDGAWTLTGLRWGPMGNSCSSTRSSAMSCTWVGVIPSINTDCMDKLMEGRPLEDLMQGKYVMAMCTCSSESPFYPRLQQKRCD